LFVMLPSQLGGSRHNSRNVSRNVSRNASPRGDTGSPSVLAPSMNRFAYALLPTDPHQRTPDGFDAKGSLRYGERDTSWSSWVCSLPERCIISPLDSSLVQRWDLLVAFGITVTAFWTPFEAAFDRSPLTDLDFSFCIDRVLDILFSRDMFL